MSGISSSTGLISGIDSSAIITQLLQIEARPQQLVQQRVLSLQQQQAAFLDLNSKVGALKSAAQKLRISKIFDSTKVSSSNADVLTGRTKPGTPAGNYSFIVDRVVNTHQLLSKGFTDRNVSGLGLTSVTLESEQARLDSETALSNLNGGAGVSRGKIVITNRAGTATTIDLSRVATVSEVLDAINSSTDAKVTASVSGGRLVLTDTSGGTGSLTVRSATGYTTAASLGIDGTIAGATLTGTNIATLGDNAALLSLNDGNGIRINTQVGSGAFDFTVTAKDGTVFNVNLGDIWGTTPPVPPATEPTPVKTATAVTTIGQLKARVASQTGGKVTLDVAPDGASVRLVDTTGGGGTLRVVDSSGAAADLGFVASKGATATTAGTSVAGKALVAGLNSRLSSNLFGGLGLRFQAYTITARDGTVFNFNATTNGSVSDYIQSINTATGGKVVASLDSAGTSIVFTDTTGGTGNLALEGAAAAELGVYTTGYAGATLTSNRINRKYVAESTTLASLNGGRGVGVGSFTIVGADGTTKTINVNDSVRTVGDLIGQIGDSATFGVRARINDAGNGIIIEKHPDFVGTDQKIVITDKVGSVAKSLNLVGTASDVGEDNFINGSFRREVELSGADTLDQVVQKINSARAGLTASVVTDGSSGTPYRLKLTSSTAGDGGRFQVSSAGLDLELALVSRGADARVFYGADDPARAILVKRNSNTVDGVIDGLSVDVLTTSASPVTLTVSRDDDASVTAIQDFVKAFNAVTAKLKDTTAYNAETQKGGVLLGDSTALSLQSELFSTLQGSGLGVGGQYRVLAQVGLSVNRDGSIAIDETKLRTALTNDPASVADVFSAFEQTSPSTTSEVPGAPGATVTNTDTRPTYIRLGVLEKIGVLADKYVDSVSGVLTARKKSLDAEITRNNDRIAALQTRLDAKRVFLQNQFAAMESALAKLQSQSTSLGSIQAIT